MMNMILMIVDLENRNGKMYIMFQSSKLALKTDAQYGVTHSTSICLCLFLKSSRERTSEFH